MTISRCILLRMRYVSDKGCRENQNTHFMFNNFFFRKSFRLWDNVEEYCIARQATDDNIIRRMRFACWITKATDTHWGCVTLIAFPRQQWSLKSASVLRYTYFACFVKVSFHLHQVFSVVFLFQVFEEMILYVYAATCHEPMCFASHVLFDFIAMKIRDGKPIWRIEWNAKFT
jgi:hypothetical protein